MWLPSPDARYAQKWLEVMSVVCVCVCVCVHLQRKLTMCFSI